MNIKIVDSWLREYLETPANPEKIAEALSLSSVSVERIEKKGNDYIYDIEVTTNRPDLMSVLGIAKEAATVLPQRGINAKFKTPKVPEIPKADISFPIEIKNDPTLVNRIMAVVLEVENKKSPKEISERLEESDIRSLSNLIDVTNYVMRETGHPAHVFDFDRLSTKKLIIRESKRGEILKTLDDKEYRLMGGDIVADNGEGVIVDLLGVMGTANSVVEDGTKRILFFLDNNNPKKIRQTSMNLGIRTEAAIINEKGIDPEIMGFAFKRGIELYEKLANGKVVSKVFDTYPNKSKIHEIVVSNEKINKIIGVEISAEKSAKILENLGFEVKKTKDQLIVTVPTIRSSEVLIEEDVIEEIARVYGYQELPSIIPSFLTEKNYRYANNFQFEKIIKNSLKHWGFTEVYTYSLISEEQFEGPIEEAIKLRNPLSSDMEYLRNSLIPSLLQVISENKKHEEIKIFEMANVYHKKGESLPKENLMLSGIIKKRGLTFFDIKGLTEAILEELGIKNIKFKQRQESPGAEVYINSEHVGYIEVLNDNLINFELNLEKILPFANFKKTYKPLTKFPAIVEDITFVLGQNINTEEIVEEIKLQSFLISDVNFIDQYNDAKTFRIKYQAEDKNLTNNEVKEIRKQIASAISNKFKASVK